MRKTLSLDYVEQHAADLTFYLLESAAPRGAVHVLEERTLELSGARVTLAIIGSSHFLEIRVGETALTEMLTCPRPGLEPDQRCSERVEQAPWERELRRHDLWYRFQFRRSGYTVGAFERETRLLSADGPNRMWYHFPGEKGPGHAVTCLEWQVVGRRATVATYHTFPGELTIVRTRSVIDVAEAGASS